MPKQSRQVTIDAIINDIAAGKSRGEVVAKIVESCHISERTFDRLWKLANEQYGIAQDKIKEELAELDRQAAIKARKKAIMSTEQRKEYLSKIITGKIKVPYTEVKWDPSLKKWETIKFVELAGHSARISAISELNKMEGSHAPSKHEVTTLVGKDLADEKYD